MAEPTGSIIRMPKVENALGQSTTSAASQKAVTDGINQAKSAASTADGKAVTAQNTATAAQTAANGAKTAADNAQKTANEAKTAAGTAQTAATNANNNANGRVPTSRKINGKVLTTDISLNAGDVGALTKAQADGYYQPKGSSSGITLGAVETKWSGYFENALIQQDNTKLAVNAAQQLGFIFPVPTASGDTSDKERPFGLTNCVVVEFASRFQNYLRSKSIGVRYRRITGGI